MKIKNVYSLRYLWSPKISTLLLHSSDELWHPRPWLIGPSACGVCGTWDRAGLFSIDLRPINTIDPSAQARFTHQKAHLKHPHNTKEEKPGTRLSSQLLESHWYKMGWGKGLVKNIYTCARALADTNVSWCAALWWVTHVGHDRI